MPCGPRLNAATRAVGMESLPNGLHRRRKTRRLRENRRLASGLQRRVAMASRRIPTRQLPRRHFAVGLQMALFAIAVMATTACGDGGPVSVGPGGITDRTGSISANHGHEAVITSAQLTAGNAVTLDIRGTADHSHTVT